MSKSFWNKEMREDVASMCLFFMETYGARKEDIDEIIQRRYKTEQSLMNLVDSFKRSRHKCFTQCIPRI